jgi:hypothetical protein
MSIPQENYLRKPIREPFFVRGVAASQSEVPKT